MKTYIKALLCLAILLCIVVGAFVFYTSLATPPAFRDGDLIFQTSTSNQASAIFVATASPYTHMGIVKKNGADFVVIEAVQPVKETALDAWINRGVLGRYAVMRHPDITSQQGARILQAAKALYGKSYDIFFSFDNDMIYCSELPYLAYQTVGVSLGTVQKVAQLNFDNALVKKLIEGRWQRHGVCTARGYDFEQCYAHILQEKLVTPASIAHDPALEKVYSNYPL